MLTLQRGATATIECSAHGFPTPAITWHKNGAAIDLKASRFAIIGSGNLQIENVELDDAGQYKCRAENSADSVDVVASLEVHGEKMRIFLVNFDGWWLRFLIFSEPPVLVKKPVDTYGRKDSDVLLECDIRGTPEPTVSNQAINASL